MTPHSEKVKSDFRRHAETGWAGATVGGAIGAFTAGPLGTIVGMVVGGVAAALLEHYVETASKHSNRHISPTK